MFSFMSTLFAIALLSSKTNWVENLQSSISSFSQSQSSWLIFTPLSMTTVHYQYARLNPATKTILPSGFEEPNKSVKRNHQPLLRSLKQNTKRSSSCMTTTKMFLICLFRNTKDQKPITSLFSCVSLGDNDQSFWNKHHVIDIMTFCFICNMTYLNRSGESSLSFFLNLLMVSSMVLPILSLISPNFSLKGNGPLFLSQSSSHFPWLSLESYLSPAKKQNKASQIALTSFLSLFIDFNKALHSKTTKHQLCRITSL